MGGPISLTGFFFLSDGIKMRLATAEGNHGLLSQAEMTYIHHADKSQCCRVSFSGILQT